MSSPSRWSVVPRARRALIASAALAPLVATACVTRPASVTTAPVTAAVEQPVASRAGEILAVLAADSLEGRMTGERGSARAAAYIAEQMRRAGLEPLGDSGYFQRVPMALAPGRGNRVAPRLVESFAVLDTFPAARRRPGVNVVGVLRGADPVLKDEIVLVDAHYDHLGIGHAVGGDSIYNGADDDASGTTAVLEIARMLAAGPRPKRTVLFVATTGEEVGLLGTRWFIAHPPLPLSKLVANLEIEMIGRPDSLAGGAGRAWLTGFERSTMGESFAAAGLPIVADRRLDQQFFERSDNIAYARMGVPAHTLSTYNMHTDYHEPSDDVEHMDVPHMERVIDAAAKAVRLLADGPVPQWKAGGRPAAEGK